MHQENKLNSIEKILKEKKLKIGYVNYPPIVYKDVKTDKLEGHFVLAIEEIANQMGIKCEYFETTWSTFTAGLQNKQFDISIAPTFSTIPRSITVAFTKPLMYVGNSALVRGNEDRFKSLDDIDKEGITIAVTQGEQGDEYAQNNIKNAIVKVLSQGDQNLAFVQVLAGRADVALGDAYAVARFAQEHQGEAKDLFSQNPYNLTAVGWAVRYDDLELLYFINTAIDVLETTGKIEEFEKKSNVNWLHVKREWISY